MAMQDVVCRVQHNESGQIRTGLVKWTHAIVGETVGSIGVLGLGRLTGPWTVQEVKLDRSELLPDLS